MKGRLRRQDLGSLFFFFVYSLLTPLTHPILSQILTVVSSFSVDQSRLAEISLEAREVVVGIVFRVDRKQDHDWSYKHDEADARSLEFYG